MHTLRTSRRSDRERLPRVDVLPLLDVVFLLLTYFIYALAVLVRVDALPVGVAPVIGSGAAAPAPEHVLTLLGDGSLRYNGEPLAEGQIEAVASRLASDPAGPTLYVALEVPLPAGAGAGAASGPRPGGADAAGPASFADRGPRIWSLLQSFDDAGLRRIALVGPPEGGP